MIRVLFFASLREALGTAALEVAHSSELATLADLQAHLVATHDGHWAEALGADNVVRAVNQEVAALDTALCDGDEVAFFPPVTGG